MINDNQKKLPHIYASAAGLNEATYRNTLRAVTGCSSCCDPRFNQARFERAMASLETVLFLRVAAGQCPNPIGKSRWIKAEFYWREKLPDDGRITSRQSYTINRIWAELQEFLPEEKYNMGYLLAIIHKATGCYQNHYATLSEKQAACLIDALNDRLAYAQKDAAEAVGFDTSFAFGANAEDDEPLRHPAYENMELISEATAV